VGIPERYAISPLEFTEEEVSLVKGQLLSLTFSQMAASSVGLARAAFEEALRYCRERVQGEAHSEASAAGKRLRDVHQGGDGWSYPRR